MADNTDGLHWEDMSVGTSVTHGAYAVTKEEIFEYARAYDPQPHHVDEEAAKRSLVKGLCASGWHSCAMMMRILCDGLLKNSASQGAAGIDEVRWQKPIRPGHVLSVRTTCLEKRRMASRPHVGIWKVRHEVLNQHNELLMTVDNAMFIGLRDPSAPMAEAQR